MRRSNRTPKPVDDVPSSSIPITKNVDTTHKKANEALNETQKPQKPAKKESKGTRAAPKTMPVIPAPDTLEAVMREFERLGSLGVETSRAWTTALFHEDIGIKKLFHHERIGLEKSLKDAYQKTIAKTSLVFVGNGSRDRAMQVVTKDTFVFAHDYPKKKSLSEFKTFKGSKLFMTVSPWHLLASFSQTLQERQEDAWQFFMKKGVTSHEKLCQDGRQDLCVNGQLIENPPMSSLYVERGAKFGNGAYVFNIDIDGKVCMTQEAREKCDEVQATAVKRLFKQKGSDGEMPRLLEISALVKETFAELFDCKAHVSWHESTGWKPSWRGYVLGPVFSSIEDARKYAAVLLPRVHQLPWYVEGLFDEHSYHKGVDRCMGSAKFETVPRVFRFLSLRPDREVSDPVCEELFNKCPNEYVLRCLGLLYPRQWDGKTLLMAGDDNPKKPKSKRKSVAVPDKRDADVFVTAVRETLLADGYVKDWHGYAENVYHDVDGMFVTLRAHEPHVFCIYKHEKGSESHTSVNAKLVFEIRVPKQGPVTLWQSCYSCDCKKKKVATFGSDLAKDLRAKAMGKDEKKSVETGKEKKTRVEYANLKDFAIGIRCAEGPPPFATKKSQ